jgi:uncharacterized protein involved in exopolysaccharide biosynthesis
MLMTYDTYNFIGGLLDVELEKIHLDYLKALDFIPYGDTSKAHNVYQAKRHRIINMKIQLQDAAASMYANHPDLETRRFWGVST